MNRYVKNSLGKYDKLYEQNIGIIEVSESIDTRLFKRAIANKLMDDGFGVLYMSYRDVITRIKQNVMDVKEY
ncbi:MAG: hypothetical protein E6902_03325 [Paeniclostridium sordellii]|nr:hypothetical protein [Paeniclostridium sordellii]